MQQKTEVSEIVKEIQRMTILPNKKLLTTLHEHFVRGVLFGLGKDIMHFDNAQPWVHYYLLHALQILGVELEKDIAEKMVQALKHCANQGFSGGHRQTPHLAPTYAAFLSLLQLGEEGYKIIDKQGLTSFFWKCKKGGKFMMHVEGECDLRASYIVTIIVKMLKLDYKLLEGVAETILASQTHEGGIANVVGGEAHGGFTFCGVAALAALGRLHELDISRLLEWLSQRQVEFGGFNGRTNKLIDSCYSFWVGSTHNIVNDYFKGAASLEKSAFLYSQQDLQKYILLYCQDDKNGGLWDKPGKLADIYHTCYALSGLSASQCFGYVLNESPVQPINAIYNISSKKYEQACAYFGK